MKILGWLRGGTRKTPDAVEARPLAGRKPETDVERMARHRRALAVENAQRAVEQARQAEREAAAQQERAEQEREWMAAIMVRHNGTYFPGDQPGLPRAGAPPGGIRAFGLEGWAQQQADMDWQARVDEAQAEEIGRGGRGGNP